MADSGFRDLKPISRYASKVTTGSNVNTFPPNTQEGIFNSLIVGVGNYVFKVTEEGMWLGAEKFENAPFRATMDGVVTIGGYSIDAFLKDGEAASDINTHTTTINGSQITTGTITADKITVSELSSLSANLGTINSGTINTVTVNGSTVNSTTINGSVINTTTLNGGTINSATLNSVAINSSTLSSNTITGNTISGNTISGGTISGTTVSASTISGNTISGGTISGTTLSGSTVSGNTISGGTVSGTTISGSVIIVPNESGGSSGYLRWSSGSRIWSDSNGYMGYRAVGNRHYFYNGTTERFVLMSSGLQNYINGGLDCRGGNLNVQRGYSVRFGQSGYTSGMTFYVNGYTYLYNTLTVYAGLAVTGTFSFTGSTSVMNCHVNSNAGVYNFGSSTSYFNYMNARGFTTHSMTSFDSLVKLPNGEEVDDITALKSIKERKEIKDEKTGRILLDKRTFPVDILVKAFDPETGKEYKRDENDDPIVGGKPRPDADGVDLVQFTSLLLGAFKQLVVRVEELEKMLKYK